MIIGSISEDTKFEKRVAITPDLVKKYKALGLEVCLSQGYALHIGIADEEYKIEGAKILSNDELSKRLKNRAEDSRDTVSLRMSMAKAEISHWIEYDYVLINENLDECVKEVLTILHAERKKKSRQNFLFEMVGKLK